MLKEIFLIISAILCVVSVAPYIKDILNGSTKPNVVTWLTWTLLTGIATAAEISAHEYTTAVFTGMATISTGSIVVLSTKYGCLKYSRLDIICQISTIVGLILWQIFSSPVIGVLASVTVDFIGAIPTIAHIWKKPREETWQTFFIGFLSAAFAVAALQKYNWISSPFPLYLVVINLVFVILIFVRRKKA